MAKADTSHSEGIAIRALVGMMLVATVRASVNPASAAAEGNVDTTVTVTGALLGDYVFLGMETDVQTGVNAAITAWVSAADTVTLKVSNGNVAAGAAIDIAATNMIFTVMRRN